MYFFLTFNFPTLPQRTCVRSLWSPEISDSLPTALNTIWEDVDDSLYLSWHKVVLFSIWRSIAGQKYIYVSEQQKTWDGTFLPPQIFSLSGLICLEKTWLILPMTEEQMIQHIIISIFLALELKEKRRHVKGELVSVLGTQRFCPTTHDCFEFKQKQISLLKMTGSSFD